MIGNAATTKIAEYIELMGEIDALKDKLAPLKKQKKELESICIDWLIDEGVDKLTMGRKTAYITRQLWASAPGSALKLLEDQGFENLAQVSTQKLSPIVREAGNAEQFYEQYPALKDIVNVSEKVHLEVRTSKKKRRS